MKAIVLAAGFATRMFPLTRDRAKPLLDVGGKPVIGWLTDRLLALPEVNELIVVANGKFHGDFEAWAQGMNARVPVKVINDHSTDDTNKLGAIGDMALALQEIDGDEPFVIAAGDNLIDFDLAPYAAAFAEEKERGLLLVRKIEGEIPPRRYNEVTLTDSGDVASFREKPDDPQSPLASICLYFLPAGVKDDIATYLAENDNHDAPGYLIEWLHTRRSFAARPLEGGWHDIGNLQTLEDARRTYGGETNHD